MEESSLIEQNESPQTKPSPLNSDAEFIGWQEMKSGESFAFYNITAANHPSFGSTVTEERLKQLGLRVPDAPLHKRHVEKLSP